MSNFEGGCPRGSRIGVLCRPSPGWQPNLDGMDSGYFFFVDNFAQTSARSIKLGNGYLGVSGLFLRLAFCPIYPLPMVWYSSPELVMEQQPITVFVQIFRPKIIHRAPLFLLTTYPPLCVNFMWNSRDRVKSSPHLRVVGWPSALPLSALRACRLAPAGEISLSSASAEVR